MFSVIVTSDFYMCVFVGEREPPDKAGDHEGAHGKGAKGLKGKSDGRGTPVV